MAEVIDGVLVDVTDKDIVDSAFNIPEGFKVVGKAAFIYTNNLEIVNISDSVTVIEQGAFVNSGLTKVRLPPGITVLGEATFANCKNLKEITLPNSLKEIGDDTFSNCTSLESITFPDSLKKIGNEAFYHCRNLKEITLSPSIEYIHEEAFKFTSLKKIYVKTNNEAELE